ncbi:hypothetical protein BO70DRAFT_365477 [Aspergillus heteromorphus CBS 117.55]|uniref:Uncharacterized protein n=1 Tax=Aspergillus heteromorphus CBS 117.55 TaxID=1448321 RepID=A0A317VA67_9EURO|nr:uncharacterized protein BO70DRAFT_365477 [Aspergillus heteromorphus CBS 117.55]PWY70181.1 hypothetical protein BO70DRAFT_365477 [Aspergillus heteromorphus CBS 117.55]
MNRRRELSNLTFFSGRTSLVEDQRRQSHSRKADRQAGRPSRRPPPLVPPSTFKQAAIGCKSSNSRAVWRSLLTPSISIIGIPRTQDNHLQRYPLRPFVCRTNTLSYYYIRMNQRASSSRVLRLNTVISTNTLLLALTGSGLANNDVGSPSNQPRGVPCTL